MFSQEQNTASTLLRCSLRVPVASTLAQETTVNQQDQILNNQTRPSTVDNSRHSVSLLALTQNCQGKYEESGEMKLDQNGVKRRKISVEDDGLKRKQGTRRPKEEAGEKVEGEFGMAAEKGSPLAADEDIGDQEKATTEEGKGSSKEALDELDEELRMPVIPEPPLTRSQAKSLRNNLTHYVAKILEEPKKESHATDPERSEEQLDQVWTVLSITKGPLFVALGGILHRKEHFVKSVLLLSYFAFVSSVQTICQGLRDITVSLNNQLKVDQKAVRAAEAVANAPREEFEAAISVVARKVFDLYVLLSSPEDAGLDPLRNIVMDLLIGKGRNGKLKKAEVFQACKDQLRKELNNHEFQKILSLVARFILKPYQMALTRPVMQGPRTSKPTYQVFRYL
ncbi:hypothetical protein Droror1_Dr00026448 [Drosera rotundifolia]